MSQIKPSELRPKDVFIYKKKLGALAQPKPGDNLFAKYFVGQVHPNLGPITKLTVIDEEGVSDTLELGPEIRIECLTQ